MHYISIGFVARKGAKSGEPYARSFAQLTNLTTTEELQKQLDTDGENLVVENLVVYHGSFANLLRVLSSDPGYRREIEELLTRVHRLGKPSV